MTDALARCCTICMVSWESCAMLTRWRTAVQYVGSYRSESNFRQKGVRNGHLEMLKAATVAAAPRQQQQCWTRPCNDSSQLRVIEASIGANKEKKASLLSRASVGQTISEQTAVGKQYPGPIPALFRSNVGSSSMPYCITPSCGDLIAREPYHSRCSFMFAFV